MTLEGKGKERAATQEERKGEIMTHNRKGERESSDPGKESERERGTEEKRSSRVTQREREVASSGP